MSQVDIEKVKITLPDGSVREYPKGITAMDIALGISEGLARNVLSAKINGEVWDLSREIPADATVQLLTWNDKEGKATFWHSSAHLMAEALEYLYPGIKFGIGPPIDQGFYYDVDFGDMEFSGEKLGEIEDKMTELAREKNEYYRQSISKQEALQYFKEKGDEYKLALILQTRKLHRFVQRTSYSPYRFYQSCETNQCSRRLLAW